MNWVWILLVGGLLALGPGGAGTPACGQTPSAEERIDAFASALMQEISRALYDAKNRPSLSVGVLDFTDEKGRVTAGSHYVGERIRLAFGRTQPFQVVELQDFETRHAISQMDFEEQLQLRERVVNDLRAHVYVLGMVVSEDRSQFQVRVQVWAMGPPFRDVHRIAPIPLTLAGIQWIPGLTDSGYAHFCKALPRMKWGQAQSRERTSLAEVLFLSQPMCDDLNGTWELRADGMIYDRRRDRESGSLKDRTGQVMQSRVKSMETLKELSYVIRDFGLVVQEEGGKTLELETYVVPKKSRYYYMPLKSGGGDGLRFEYLWFEPGKSTEPAMEEGAGGWRFFNAQGDWALKMPLGVHTATATFSPVAESIYGSKMARSEFIRRCKFFVAPGLNVYTVNYVYRRDKPEIFFSRLEIGPSKEERQGGRGVQEIVEHYPLYGTK